MCVCGQAVVGVCECEILSHSHSSQRTHSHRDSHTESQTSECTVQRVSPVSSVYSTSLSAQSVRRAHAARHSRPLRVAVQYTSVVLYKKAQSSRVSYISHNIWRDRSQNRAISLWRSNTNSTTFFVAVRPPVARRADSPSVHIITCDAQRVALRFAPPAPPRPLAHPARACSPSARAETVSPPRATPARASPMLTAPFCSRPRRRRRPPPPCPSPRRS